MQCSFGPYIIFLGMRIFFTTVMYISFHITIFIWTEVHQRCMKYQALKISACIRKYINKICTSFTDVFLEFHSVNSSPSPAMVKSWLQCLTTIQTCPSRHLLRVVSQHKYSPCPFLQYTQTKMTRISEHHSEHSVRALCIRSWELATPWMGSMSLLQ